jgi:hypothetical protein
VRNETPEKRPPGLENITSLGDAASRLAVGWSLRAVTSLIPHKSETLGCGSYVPAEAKDESNKRRRKEGKKKKKTKSVGGC